MSKLLIFIALLALVALAACADPAPTAVVSPTATSQPGWPTPADDQPEPTATAGPTREPTEIATPRPAETPTTAPQPTAAAAPVPTTISIPEPTATATIAPTPAATSVPTPTRMPTPTPAPAATAIPTPAAALKPTSTPAPEPTQPPAQPAANWRGIIVASEYRCSPYDSDDYPYSPSVEPRIVEELGGVYGPYTGTWFESIRETDIEHIVARSEAHDSGLCEGQPCSPGRVRIRPPEPHAGVSQRQPAPEGGQGRGRMAPRPEPVLVRGPHHSGPPRIRAHHRPCRGRRDRQGPVRVCVLRYDRAGARNLSIRSGDPHSSP